MCLGGVKSLQTQIVLMHVFNYRNENLTEKLVVASGEVIKIKTLEVFFPLYKPIFLKFMLI